MEVAHLGPDGSTSTRVTQYTSSDRLQEMLDGPLGPRVVQVSVYQSSEEGLDESRFWYQSVGHWEMAEGEPDAVVMVRDMLTRPGEAYAELTKPYAEVLDKVKKPSLQ